MTRTGDKDLRAIERDRRVGDATEALAEQGPIHQQAVRGDSLFIVGLPPDP
ncbi:MAG: hypothetical protein VX836_04785 [Pseudomonadota bacterium]|nr:hypothetical protein [Pseudomonadota bacterium]